MLLSIPVRLGFFSPSKVLLMTTQVTPVSMKTILSAAFATLIEWFDFSIYIYIASYISQLFFPPQQGLAGLLETFAVFAVGYLMRPIGGIVFGQLGDRIGRKKTIMLTVACMGVSILMTSCLPTYQQIGIAAPILLLLARMLQGFSVGGEQTGVIVMLIEQSDQRYRGLYTSIATFISGNGVLLSSLLATVLINHLSHEQMLSFGWRIPYWIGSVLTVLALLFQSRMKESPFFEALSQEKHVDRTPMRGALKSHPWAITIVFFLTGYLGIAYYLNAAFLPNYLITILGTADHTAMVITSCAAFAYAYSAPFWGWLSDGVGRKPVLITGVIALAVFSYPLFLMLGSHHLAEMITAAVLMMLMVSACTPPFITTISELFPTEHRYSGVSFGYNVGNALMGGTTPLLSTYLISVTGHALAPCWYLVIASCCIMIVLLKMPETRSMDLHRVSSH